MAIQKNDIPEKLKQDSSVRLWAASGRFYLLAKRVIKMQMVLVAAIPVALYFTAIVCPCWKSWVALYGVVITILDAVIPYYILKHLKETAARIQEKYDCDLLGLEWNDHRAGKKPSEEEISDAYRKARVDDVARNRATTWYPNEIGQVPLPVARILCQRANVVWDSGLRRRYARWILGILWVLIATVFFVTFWRHMDIRDFVLVGLSPILPLLMWLIREYIRQKESADVVEKIRDDVMDIWEKLMSNGPTDELLTTESRHFQDRIFDHRKTNTPILDFVYKWCRSGQEGSMVEATEKYVVRYLEKHQEPKD